MTEKLALVTGGAQGIGYACAEALTEDGFRCILADIQTDKVREAASRLGGIAMTCDMSDADQIGAMFDTIAADHGPLHALVNNAGIAMPGDPLDYALEDFRNSSTIKATSC